MGAPLVARPRMFGWHGVHGAGKSVLAAQAAEWFWETRQLKTRVVSYDAGSAEQYDKGVAAGYIDYLAADGWTSHAPDVFLTRIAEGAWPESSQIPNSQLMPGYEEVRLCTKCGKDSGSRGHAHLARCAACGFAFPAGRPLSLTRNLTGLEGIGLQVFEGLSTVSAVLLEAQRQSRPGDKFYYGGDAEAQKVARVANEGLKKKDPATRTPAEREALVEAARLEEAGVLGLASSAEMGHYFKAGQDIQKILKASNRCPIPMVIWTAHSGRWEESTDKTNPNAPRRLMGLGPALVPAKGMMQALPDFVLFGHVVTEGGGQRVLHLDRHKGPESGTVLWEAKCNIVGMPKLFPLPDPTKANGFAALMVQIEKAKA